MNKFVFVVLAMLAVTQAQLDPALLNDPIYQPFIKIVLDKASICIADPAITSGKFAVSSCPGLVSIMTDIHNNVTNPAIACQPSCVSVFNTLDDACHTALRAAFTSGGTDPIDKAGVAFFDACDKVGPAVSPVPAPATTSPSPSPSPTPTPSPSPSPSPVLSPTPVPSPVTPASAAVQIIPQVLTVFAAFAGGAMILA